ncbi:MAG: vWA domain-containing protein [Bacteroidota bacterium]
MIPAEISLSLRGNVLLAIVLVIGGIIAAFAYYRYTLPPLPPRRRILLSIVRSFSLALLLLLFFEPIIRIVHRDEQRPRIAVLIDDTQSMTVKDKQGERAALMRQWLHDDRLKKLPGPVEARYYTFSSKLRPGNPSVPDSIAFGGETTDLSTVFAQLKDRLVKENIQAAVVLSDGDYTVGKNPVYDAKSLGIPIYAIGVGDTNEQKDILVEKIVTNTVAYAETKVPVQITVRSSGYNGENVEVHIAEGKNVLDRKMIQLAEGTREYHVDLSVEPKEEGVKKYVVSVSTLPGELTDRNNSQTVFMRVLKSKLKILIFAGAPSPDVPAVRQALLEDSHFSVNVFVQKNSTDFYEGRFSQSQLDSADCFVFIGYPGRITSPGLLTQLKDAIDRTKKPLMFVASATIDYQKLAVFQSYLPFTWNAAPGEMQVFPAVIDRYKNHPLITLEGGMTADAWTELPPLNKNNTSFRAKAESQVLCAVSVQNVILPEPLVAIRNVNRFRSYAITGQNVWQWRLMAQGNPHTEKFFPLLMSNVIRWLTTKEDAKNVRIIPSKQIFTTAEPVDFTAQVYDEQLEPMDNAEVNVDIHKADESSQIALHAVGNGVYEGSAEGLGEGDYTYSGKVNANGRLYGEDAGRFSIGGVNVEFLETRMNKQLLEQLSFTTNGKYYDLAGSGSLNDDLLHANQFASKELVQASEIELWNWQYFLAALVLLFAIEWFIRKINGML